MRRNKIICYILPVVFVAITSCHRKLEKNEYVAFIRDYSKGLHVKKQQGDFLLDLQYLPLPYRAMQQGVDVMDQQIYNSFLLENQDLQYYAFTLSLKDSTQDVMQYNAFDEQTIQQKGYYFSYRFQEDIFLEEAGVKLPCVLFHMERSDLKNSRTFLLAFENSNQKLGEVRVHINSPYLGTLPITLKVSKENLPILDL